MKILKIRVRNLASLVGTQEAVIFGEGGLEGGLVAVTGATGSGKSTLIDAVCLALYGTTPRLMGAGGDTEARQVGNLLSRGTKDAFAEVEFLDMAGRHLCSKWSISMSHSGKLQPPKMSLTEMFTDPSTGRTTGQVITDMKSEVPVEVARTIGMDFKQFNGVVVLSQGSFSSFLKGNEEERSILLQRLTGTAVYEQLSRAAFADEKAKRLAIEKLEQAIATNQPLPAQERTDLELRKAQLEERDSTQRQQLETTRLRHRHLDNLRLATSEVAGAKERQAKAEAEQGRSKPDKEKLENSRRAEVMRVHLDREQRSAEALEKAQKNVARSTARQDEIQKEEEALRRKFLEGAGRLKSHVDTLEKEKLNNAKHAHAEPGRCRTIEEKLLALGKSTKSLSQNREQLPKVTLKLEEARNRCLQSAEQNEAIKKQVVQCRDELGKYEQALVSLAHEHGSLEKLVEGKARLDQASTTLEDLKATRQTLEKESEQVAELAQKMVAGQLSVGKAEATVKELQQRRHDLQTAHDTLRLVVDLLDHRHNLREGEPCPLCTSIVAHVPGDLPQSELRQSEARLGVATRELESAQEALTRARSEETQTKARATVLEDSMARLNELNLRLGKRLADQLMGVGIGEVSPEEAGALILERRQEITDTLARMEATAMEVQQARSRLEKTERERESVQRKLAEAEKTSALLQAELNTLMQQEETTKASLVEQECAIKDLVCAMAKDCGLEAPAFQAIPDWLAKREELQQKHLALVNLLAVQGPGCQELCSTALSLFEAGTSWPVRDLTGSNEGSLKACKKEVESLGKEHRHSPDRAGSPAVPPIGLGAHLLHLI